MIIYWPYPTNHQTNQYLLDSIFLSLIKCHLLGRLVGAFSLQQAEQSNFTKLNLNLTAAWIWNSKRIVWLVGWLNGWNQLMLIILDTNKTESTRRRVETGGTADGAFANVFEYSHYPGPAAKKPGPRLNIKTVLSTYGDFHVKDKTAVRTSYL